MMMTLEKRARVAAFYRMMADEIAHGTLSDLSVVTQDGTHVYGNYEDSSGVHHAFQIDVAKIQPECGAPEVRKASG